MGTKVNQCKNCIYWNKVKLGDTHGECRVSHPTVFVVVGADVLGRPQPGTFSAFPSVEGETGWCGEGELKSEMIS